jgi:hypothetical protein
MKISKFTQIIIKSQAKLSLPSKNIGVELLQRLSLIKNIVTLNEFDNVWWSGISKVMASYPKMF